MRLLVLGSTGMLGSMVYDFFSNHTQYRTVGTTRATKKKRSLRLFDVLAFLKDEKKYSWVKEYDYVINCIGIIKPFCKDDDPKGIQNAIRVNSLFPYSLANFLQSSRARVIQIATDCVYSGQKGNYDEDDSHDALDVYGKTKSLGEVIENDTVLNIRCSIVGPEKGTSKSLLEWFISQKKGSSICGFTHHRWNGATTLQFAQLCYKIIERDYFVKIRADNHVVHFIPNATVTKFELLRIFNDVYGKELKIKKENLIGAPIDRTLSTKYSTVNKLIPNNNVKQAIRDLYKYSS